MLLSQRVKTVTHAVELRDFVQNCIRAVKFAAFLRSPETRGIQMGPHVWETLKKGSRSISKSGTLMKAIKMR